MIFRNYFPFAFQAICSRLQRKMHFQTIIVILLAIGVVALSQLDLTEASKFRRNINLQTTNRSFFWIAKEISEIWIHKTFFLCCRLSILIKLFNYLQNFVYMMVDTNINVSLIVIPDRLKYLLWAVLVRWYVVGMLLECNNK